MTSRAIVNGEVSCKNVLKISFTIFFFHLTNIYLKKCKQNFFLNFSKVGFYELFVFFNVMNLKVVIFYKLEVVLKFDVRLGKEEKEKRRKKE